MSYKLPHKISSKAQVQVIYLQCHHHNNHLSTINLSLIKQDNGFLIVNNSNHNTLLFIDSKVQNQIN